MVDRTPHPRETEYNPYDEQELSQLPQTKSKRPLLITAKNIRTTEAQLERKLRELGVARGDDLRSAQPANANINPTQPRGVSRHDPRVRSAKTLQQNLRSHYQRWVSLCEQYKTEVAQAE
jgi:hypothetical protein